MVPDFAPEENSAKQWARSKRQLKHGAQRDARFAGVHGHTARAPIPNYSSYGRDARRNMSTIEKKTVSDSHARHQVGRGCKKLFSGVSPLEECLGFRMCNDIVYSLNKRKRWLRFDEALPQIRASEIRSFALEEPRNRWHKRKGISDKVIAFYEDDLDEERADMCKIEDTPLDELCSRQFIKDTFWTGITIRQQKRVARRTERETMNYWRNIRDVHPTGVNEPRFESVRLRSASVLHKTRVRAATVSSMHYKNVWCPSALDDSRDFLTADLSEDKFVTHVGTKGRFPELSSKSGQPTTKEEYVRKYRLFYRQRGKHDWLPLGTFQGNSDRNTEVVHKLVNVHTGKVGIHAAEFRFQPLSKAEGGFKNRKAMRVALYGTPRESTEHDEDGNESQSPKGQSGASRLFDRNTNGVFFHIAQAPERDEQSNFGYLSWRRSLYNDPGRSKRQRRLLKLRASRQECDLDINDKLVGSQR